MHDQEKIIEELLNSVGQGVKQISARKYCLRTKKSLNRQTTLFDYICSQLHTNFLYIADLLAYDKTNTRTSALCVTNLSKIFNFNNCYY